MKSIQNIFKFFKEMGDIQVVVPYAWSLNYGYSIMVPHIKLPQNPK
jgi:hypothetical protein